MESGRAGAETTKQTFLTAKHETEYIVQYRLQFTIYEYDPSC